MKKTVLAMVVPALLTAGAASASVNLYEADGFSVNLGGTADIQWYKSYKPTDEPILRLNKGKLIFTTDAKISDSLSTVSGMGFEYKGQLQNDVQMVENKELWIGLSSNDFGTITFGRQYLLVEDANNQKDYELGLDQINFVITSANQVIKWVYDNGTFNIGADIALDSDPSKNIRGREIFTSRIGVRYEGLDARVYLYDGESIQTNKFNNKAGISQDIRGYNLEMDYGFNAFDVAFSYGQVGYKNHTVKSDKVNVDVLGISGGYLADEKTYFAVGYDWSDANKSGNSGNRKNYKSASLYTNVAYKLHSMTKVYAEVGVAKVKSNNQKDSTDTAFALGMKVKF
ncbi:porin [Candidatus Enterovibrio escicola]|uniref:Porin-like protein H n=1 Tax=Candidatus Enterovibrio escicola TaxID=1927127 RepID=A0A2A5T258_9GAMM|nr:porin [Candidatus Enterovibrio escacola]PCS22242.1 Porin-like protein H precursor [Candidatus Enterovibrio escacola]